MRTFIIDHKTRNANVTIRLLGKRKDVMACQFHGLYYEDKECCQIYVATTMTEDELDHWLWVTKSVGNYIGVVETEDMDLVGTETYKPDEC